MSLTAELDRRVLYLFLRLGFSSRRIDRAIGRDPMQTKGWFSWSILKGFHLKEQDRGTLFAYSAREAEKIVLILQSGGSASALRRSLLKTTPAMLRGYSNIYVSAPGEKELYYLLSGLTRNLTRNFFIGQKRALGKCQLDGCRNSKAQIDTAHIADERPSLFMKIARESRRRGEKGNFVYPIYPLVKKYLESHQLPKSIAFLCRPHHGELDGCKISDPARHREMVRKIQFD